MDDTAILTERVTFFISKEQLRAIQRLVQQRMTSTCEKCNKSFKPKKCPNVTKSSIFREALTQYLTADCK